MLRFLSKSILQRPSFRSYASRNFPPHTIMAMPALSPTMTQGNLGQWHKKVGDSIAPGDVLVEIETDKAQMDFECQEDGYVAQILAQAGTKDVLVSVPIAVIVEEESDVAAFAQFTIADIQGGKKDVASIVEEKANAITERVEVVEGIKESMVSQKGKIMASPIAKMMANEKGISLNALSGTGPDGLIVKADVEHYKAPAVVQTVTKKAEIRNIPTNLETSSNSFSDSPVSGIRKIIADRLLQSKTTIPHYYLTMEINVDKVLKLRQALNADANGMFKLSVNDFIIKASALALQKVPTVNSSWHETFIRQYASSDICVAVATSTGLITPIILNSNTLGLSGISERVKSLAARAKLGQLQSHEYVGGSFTISNLGMYDIKSFTAIINPPHAAILAVGGVSDKVVKVNDEFTEVKVMQVTLSCDHRVVDGAVGAEWLGSFKGYLENPLSMLL